MNEISVIIPVYNTDEFIDECLNSVFKQTYQNIEIILINDGSNQKCTEKLISYNEAYDNIRLLHFNKNKGVGAARNYGLQESTGEFIYFLDSDDYLPEMTLDILISNIQESSMIRGRIKTTHFARSFAVIFENIYNKNIYSEKKYNLIKNKSALNFLFRKDFIKSNNLKFNEDVSIYSDLWFMIPAMEHVAYVPHIKEAIYFKRKRNDPILNPSLAQSEDTPKINDFLQMYNTLKDRYTDILTTEFLDTQLLNFYRKNIVTYFQEPSLIDDYFQELSRTLSRVEVDILNTYDVVLKKEIQLLKKGNAKKYKRINNRHHLLRDIRKGFKSKRQFKILVYKRFFNKLPLKNRWVFYESFQGRSYSDSPKYIYQHMIHSKMNYKYIWSDNSAENIPGKPVKVKRLSLRYFYYLARSKYWVSNSRMPRYIEKRKYHVYLQTWHGTPLKRLAGDMKDVFMPGTNSEKYKKNFYNETSKWDYLVSPNAYSTEIFKRAFWFDKTFIESGYPRNDILYNHNNNEDILTIKKKLNLPLDKKVILYAPTWRDDEFYAKGKYKFTLALDLLNMQEQLGDEYIILLRMHYFVASQMDVSQVQEFAFDVSSYSDVGELYLISDMLITDYSSVFFDYAHLKRPILFYTYDLDKYRNQLRGFYFDMEKEVPGPLLETTDEIIESITHVEQVKKEFHNRYDEFYNTYCLWDNGNASRKVVDEVFRK